MTLRLLAVLAHPDDETLGAGGVFARYSAEGVETHLVTATRGDRGRFRGVKDGPGHPGPAELARIREGELRAAAAVLGIHGVTILGYGDGRVDEAEPREAVARIAGEIRRVRPHVVITFAPDGAYGHPDHVAVSQFATAALVVAADPAHNDGAGAALPPHAVSKLYYMASSRERWDAYQAAFKKLTSMVDGVERQAQPWPEWMITTVIDTREQWPTVWRAVTCHDSQIGGYEKLRDLEPAHHEALWGRLEFYRALSVVNGGRRVETDLFEGLRDGATR
ncbi:MAG TPA: PIG-L family deacetylase [Candidatus Limnocylindrales bacterium]|nr:PIG-L family deacetylase [Candidatus Limnocylindrales bacterium]